MYGRGSCEGQAANWVSLLEAWKDKGKGEREKMHAFAPLVAFEH